MGLTLFLIWIVPSLIFSAWLWWNQLHEPSGAKDHQAESESGLVLVIVAAFDLAVILVWGLIVYGVHWMLK